MTVLKGVASTNLLLKAAKMLKGKKIQDPTVAVGFYRLHLNPSDDSILEARSLKPAEVRHILSELVVRMSAVESTANIYPLVNGVGPLKEMKRFESTEWQSDSEIIKSTNHTLNLVYDQLGAAMKFGLVKGGGQNEGSDELGKGSEEVPKDGYPGVDEEVYEEEFVDKEVKGGGSSDVADKEVKCVVSSDEEVADKEEESDLEIIKSTFDTVNLIYDRLRLLEERKQRKVRSAPGSVANKFGSVKGGSQNEGFDELSEGSEEVLKDGSKVVYEEEVADKEVKGGGVCSSDVTSKEVKDGPVAGGNGAVTKQNGNGNAKTGKMDDHNGKTGNGNGAGRRP